MSSSKSAQVAAERERARQWKDANLRTSSDNAILAAPDVASAKRSSMHASESSSKRRRTMSPQRAVAPAPVPAPAPAPAAGVRSSRSPLRHSSDAAPAIAVTTSNSSSSSSNSRKAVTSSSAAKQSRKSLSSSSKSRSSTPLPRASEEASPVPAPARRLQRPVATVPAPAALPPSPPRQRQASSPAVPVVAVPAPAAPVSVVVRESYSKEKSLTQQREAARRWKDEQLSPGVRESAEPAACGRSGSSKKTTSSAAGSPMPANESAPLRQPQPLFNSILVFIVSSMLSIFKHMWPFNCLFPGGAGADDTTAASIATTVVAVATGGWSAYTLWWKVRAAALFLDQHKGIFAIASAAAAAAVLTYVYANRRRAQARARKLLVDRMGSLVKRELSILDFYPIDYIACDIVDVVMTDSWEGWRSHGALAGFDPSLAKDGVAALWSEVRAEVERDSCVHVSDRLVQGKQRKCWKMVGIRTQLTPMKN